MRGTLGPIWLRCLQTISQLSQKPPASWHKAARARASRGSVRSIHEHGAWWEAGSAILPSLRQWRVPIVGPGLADSSSSNQAIKTAVGFYCVVLWQAGHLCASYSCYFMLKKVEIPISENVAPLLLGQPTLPPRTTVRRPQHVHQRLFMWLTESITYLVLPT